LIVALLVASGRHAVDVWCVYSSASKHWRAHAPLYDLSGIDYFQYFPQAAIAFIPFDWLGRPWGDIAWRWVGWALFGFAIWRVCGMGWRVRRPTLFVLTTGFVIAPAMISLLNGQANLHVAGLMLHAAVDLYGRNRGRLTLWLTVGLGVKPLMAVMILFVCVVDPSMLGRLALSTALLAATPFATAPLAYVLSQYHDCAIKLTLSAHPDRHFEDLRGLLWKLGWEIPYLVLRALSLFALLGALAAAKRVQRQLDARDGAVVVYAIAAGYLMLFNSRTQPNSYVIIAPAAAFAGAHFVATNRWRGAAIMAAIVACWCGSAIWLTENWLKPLTCIVFCALLSHRLKQTLETAAPLLDIDDRGDAQRGVAIPNEQLRRARG
jgi:hypothetical protein